MSVHEDVAGLQSININDKNKNRNYEKLLKVILATLAALFDTLPHYTSKLANEVMS